MRKDQSSDKSRSMTLSGDQFIGELYHDNKALIPQATDWWGRWVPLFDRFVQGNQDAPPVSTFPLELPNATFMNE